MAWFRAGLQAARGREGGDAEDSAALLAAALPAIPHGAPALAPYSSATHRHRPVVAFALLVGCTMLGAYVWVGHVAHIHARRPQPYRFAPANARSIVSLGTKDAAESGARDAAEAGRAAGAGDGRAEHRHTPGTKNATAAGRAAGAGADRAEGHRHAPDGRAGELRRGSPAGEGGAKAAPGEGGRGREGAGSGAKAPAVLVAKDYRAPAGRGRQVSVKRGEWVFVGKQRRSKWAFVYTDKKEGWVPRWALGAPGEGGGGPGDAAA